jgi:hypothetical protein
MNILKLFVGLILVTIILGVGSFIKGDDQPLEVTYPAFPNITPPARQPVFLPDYIRYVYQFAVITSAIIAFLAVLIGGFRYITSAGNPAQTSDARNQILMALIGLIVILGSYVVLQEINPDLISLEPPNPDLSYGDGIIIYTDGTCGQGSNGYPDLYEPVPDGTEYKIIKGTKSINPMDVGSFWTFEGAPYLNTIDFLKTDTCEGDAEPNHSFSPQNANTCIPTGDLNNPTGNLNNIECVRMKRNIPGVWLFSYENGNPENPEPDKGIYKVFQQDWSKLPDGLRGNIRTIALVPDKQANANYGVILHQETGSRQENKGWANLYIPQGDEVVTFTGAQLENINAQSITVFQIDASASSRAITLYENADYKCQPDEEGECQDASIKYEWGAMQSIPGMNSEIARAIVLKENDDLWWEPDGDEVHICWREAWNIIGHITWRTGGCFKGVSAIKHEEGSSYLTILYASDDGKIQDDGRGDAPAIVIDGSVRNLGTYNFNEVTGIIFVIKVKRSN